MLKKTNATILANTTIINGNVDERWSITLPASETPIIVYMFTCDNKYVASRRGLSLPISGAVVCADDAIVLASAKDSIVPRAGDIVVFRGEKTENRFVYSKKALAIISYYEAVRAYYMFLDDFESDTLATTIDLDEKITYALAKYADAEKLWTETVCNTLASYDSKVMKRKKKFIKDMRKATKKFIKDMQKATKNSQESQLN